MKKTHQTIIPIVCFIIILAFTESAFSEDSCIIQWWGDKSGFIPTNETSLTEATASQAFTAIIGFDPVECGIIGLTYTCADQTFIEFEASGYDDSQTSTVGFIRSDNCCYPPPGWSEVGPPTLHGEWDVVCGLDSDSDGFIDNFDNCPEIANPNQEDVDNNETGDVCDPNTIYGTISGDIQAGVEVILNIYSCGLVDLEGTVTNSEGYYAFGGLQNRSYSIVPEKAGFTFTPWLKTVPIPQTEIQSYDFTATLIPTCDSVDRFLDNGDGTVTDCRTDLIWLKNANCFGGLTIWHGDGIEPYDVPTGLNSGECGLSDGSTEGDWHLATKEELQGIGTDPPTTWFAGAPSVNWTKPGSPFDGVQSFYYWSSTWDNTPDIWSVDLSNGDALDVAYYREQFVWPVRSPN